MEIMGDLMTSLQSTYDGFADTYEANRGLFDMGPVFEDFWNGLGKERGDALDLGCGAGEPFARTFIERGWRVTGVDFSLRMLELAARYVPDMRRIHSDMSQVEFAPHSFDAVTAIYSLFHLPRAQHPALFSNIQRWLRPGGKLLFTYATQHYTGEETFDGTKAFMGNPLYYSHDTPEQLRRQLAASGLEIEREDWREIGGETFLWVTAINQPS